MPDDLTEQKREQLARELADAPQGHRDAEMSQGPNPFGGQVGPDPSDADLAMIDLGETPGQGDEAEQTGEESDPGVAEAGGVNAANTDGSTRTRQP